MTTTTRASGRDASPLATQRFVERVLDELEVTERAYHHLNFSLPLVSDLVRRARTSAEPGDRVLLIGGSTLIAECLVRLGYQLDIWQFSQAYLTDAMKPLVTRRITPEALDAFEPTDERYRLIIVPLVVEALRVPAADFLRSLRTALEHDGRVIVATSNQVRLDSRLSAIAGRTVKPKAEAAAVSLSWPAIPTVREYHSTQLRAASQTAGYTVRACEPVVSERAFLEMEPLNVYDYARRKLRGAVMHSLPNSRDVVVAELSPRIGADAPAKTRIDDPFVSVFVSARHGGQALRETIGALQAQTYPSELYEIVVLHDGTLEDVPAIVGQATAEGASAVREHLVVNPEGPAARNQAMVESRSDICAHTDDSSYLPADWLQAAISWFDADTVAVTGPVFLKSESERRFLSVPGTRPDPDDRGVSPQGVFSIANVFYRTPVAVAAGGFDRAFSRQEGVAAVGWDTELAWRLQRFGWQTRFREDVYQFRRFAPDDSRRLHWVRDQMRRAEDVPALMAAVPEYAAKNLAMGVFASKQTMYFDMALAGLAMAATQRQWPWLLASLPWLAQASHHVDVWPPSGWSGSARTLGRLTARQLVWLAGFAKGSVKARRIVL